MLLLTRGTLFGDGENASPCLVTVEYRLRSCCAVVCRRLFYQVLIGSVSNKVTMEVRSMYTDICRALLNQHFMRLLHSGPGKVFVQYNMRQPWGDSSKHVSEGVHLLVYRPYWLLYISCYISFYISNTALHSIIVIIYRARYTSVCTSTKLVPSNNQSHSLHTAAGIESTACFLLPSLQYPRRGRSSAALSTHPVFLFASVRLGYSTFRRACHIAYIYRRSSPPEL